MAQRTARKLKFTLPHLREGKPESCRHVPPPHEGHRWPRGRRGAQMLGLVLETTPSPFFGPYVGIQRLQKSVELLPDAECFHLFAGPPCRVGPIRERNRRLSAPTIPPTSIE